MTEQERRHQGRRSSDQLINVFHGNHHAMAIIDAQLEIRQLNRRGQQLLSDLKPAGRLFAGPNHKLLRWQLSELVSAVIEGQITDGAMEAQLQDLTLAIECQILQPNQTAVLTFRDITTQQQRQNQFLCLGATAAGIAHELASPLAALSTELELIQHGERLEVNTCQRLVERMQLILRELSGCYAAPDLDNHQPLTVNTTVQKAVRLLRFDPRSQQIHWQTLFQPSLPTLQMTEKHLLLVLLNLLDNAIKACHGQTQGEIQIEASADPNRGLTLTVSDNGADSADQSSTPTYQGGLGIGLTISHQIMHSYGGELTLESRGDGACARLQIPAHQCLWSNEEIQGEQG